MSSQAYFLFQTYKFTSQQLVLLLRLDFCCAPACCFKKSVSVTNLKSATLSAVEPYIELLHILEHVSLRSLLMLSSSVFRLSFRCSVREGFPSIWYHFPFSVISGNLIFHDTIQWYSVAIQ